MSERSFLNQGGILRLRGGREIRPGERFKADPALIPPGARDRVVDVTPEKKEQKKSSSKKTSSSSRRRSSSQSQQSESQEAEGGDDGSQGGEEAGEFSL
jgi:hypothetical protein